MKQYLDLFRISVLGGIAISIGGAVFLNTENPVVGSFLFSLGLIMVCHFAFGLYTGRVQHLVEVSVKTAPNLVFIYLGNLAGTLLVGYSLMFCGKADAVARANAMVQYKLSLPMLDALVLSIMCGILMYVAVTGFKKISDPVGRHLIVCLPVMVFINSGYEHSIADLFYISIAGAWNMDAVIFSVIAAAGNLIGCCFIPVVLLGIKPSP